MNSVPPLLVTIDGPSTKDIDDAFSLKNTDTGWRLTVAIAAPATEVPPGSEIDLAARQQAASVYAGPRVIKSMLPIELSEQKCSLLAGSERMAMIITIDLDNELRATETRVHFEPVKVSHRLTYEDVPRLAKEDGALGRLMYDASNVAKALLGVRRNAGALAFFDLKSLIYLDEDGALQRAASADDMVGHIVIQEFMVLANTELSRWAIEHEIPFIYRSHRPKLAAPPVADLLEAMQTMSPEALREQMTVIMSTAVYSAHAHGHYALNLPFYAHSTSPLRRYVDLVNQRQVHAYCSNEPYPHSQDDLVGIAQQINDTLAQAKMDRSDGFKAVVVNRAARALEGGQLERLGDPELVQAIKLAASTGSMPESLAAHLAMRMTNEGLADKVLDAMVTASTAIKLPDVLVDAWVDLLTGEPTRAKHFLMFAVQTGQAEEHSAHNRAIETTGFAVEVRLVRLRDGAKLTAKALAPRKKDAENLASARIMCQFLGAPATLFDVIDVLPDSAPAAAVPTATDALSPSDRRNYKGEIMEFCQRKRIAPPAFEVSATGPSNDPRFACRATLLVAGAQKSVSFEGAKTKKDAEAGASRKLLAEVDRSESPTSAASRIAS